MDKVSYQFVKESNNLIFRSKVNSFNLDHVTDKDIASFYTSFSQYSYFDTGLLPLDGTGLLGIRKAGNHTQVIYQYKPGMYYINWGAYEKDSDYTKYYLAQPYRIVLIDFLDNNLLGARTFYCVEPANHGAVQLYHVNLPNINCKGYRGNGVGWICLYHNEDWSQLSFNDRLNRALERCSGVEVYNDANMNETDGPRFYAQNNMPEYVSIPEQWQKKSELEGYEWTLDSSQWLPILVKDRDHQEKHYENGSPLTLVDAITGNYSAYYGDTFLPKPINAITRSDLNIEISQITNWFVKSFNSSSTIFAGIDPYSSSTVYKEEIALTSFGTASLFDQEEQQDEDEEQQDEDQEDEESENDPNLTFCPMSQTWVSLIDCGPHIECIVDEDDIYHQVCMNCVNNNGMNYVYVKNAMKFYSPSSKDIIHDQQLDEYYLISAIKNPWTVCTNCTSVHISLDPNKLVVNVWDRTGGIDLDDFVPVQICDKCIVENNSLVPTIASCSMCNCSIPSETSFFYPNTITPHLSLQIAVAHSDKIKPGLICTLCTHNVIAYQELLIPNPQNNSILIEEPF